MSSLSKCRLMISRTLDLAMVSSCRSGAEFSFTKSTLFFTNNFSVRLAIGAPIKVPHEPMSLFSSKRPLILYDSIMVLIASFSVAVSDFLRVNSSLFLMLKSMLKLASRYHYLPRWPSIRCLIFPENGRCAQAWHLS